MTALGQPKLLERVSGCLVAIRDLFRVFDADLNGIISRDEFERVSSKETSGGDDGRCIVCV